MNHVEPDWDDVAVEDFGEIVAGGTPSRAVSSFWNGQIPWITPAEITSLSGKYVRDTKERITPEGLAGSAARLLPVGSLLVTTRATLGEVAIAAVPVATNQGFKSIIPNGETDPLFAYYCIGNLKREMVRLASGTTFLEISKADFSRIRTRRPKLPEQSRIAAVLDAVDEAIVKTEAVIAKLKQVRAGLLHDLLTRGLDEGGQLRDPILHPEEFLDTAVGRLPREWRFSRFDEVLEGIDAGKSPDYPDRPAPPGEWGVLKVSAIWPEGFRPNENKWVTKEVHCNTSDEVHDGDLLISRSNTYELVGLVCLVRNAPPRLMLCDKTLRLRLKANRGINPFFALLLQTRTARSQIEVNATGTSGSMKNISQDVIRSLQLGYPQVDEQRRILIAASPVAGELEVSECECLKLRALKCGLMADLLTGRVRVPEDVGVAS